MPKSTQDSVIIVPNEKGEPDKVIIKNGKLKWYSLKEMNYGDFVEYLGADTVQDPPEQ